MSDIPAKMTAALFDRYGPPSVLSLNERDVPVPKQGEVLIKVRAASINPSDIRNVEGVFHAPLPRIPGRDYAGTVVAGEAHVGMDVWGSGPRFGIARDGAHAQYIVVPADWLSEKPPALSMRQAASVGVPFITAWSALVTEGRIQSGETILIIGAAGAVGRAATAIALWKGAKVIPAIRAKGAVSAGTIDTATQDIPRAVRDLTGGEGADLVLDCVGGSLFEPALLSLRLGGRHLVIVSRGMRRVSFDLTDFYHNRIHLIGVDSLGLTGPEIASIMDELRPGFEAGALKPFEVKEWGLDDVVAAYEAADRGGDSAKQILLPP
jgi:NADPH:quinone reductase-like Zn-dependent oxidoreductase